MSARGLLALLAAAAPGGCDYFAAPDPLELDPDVISIAIVLVAGESHAEMLVGHPHRRASAAPPTVTASLIGPGWRFPFSYTTDPEEGCGGGPTSWSFPMVCLNASLPEPILEGIAYRLEGEGPKGSFTGETVIPLAPLVLDPGDTVRLRRPADSSGWFRIPIRYRASSEVGTLRPEMFGTLRQGDGFASRWIQLEPRALDVDDRTDTLSLSGYYEPRFVRGSAHLLGIGWHYTNFRSLSETRFPWPNFGVSGEGVYGYFDGSAKSRRVRIIVDEAGDAGRRESAARSP